MAITPIEGTNFGHTADLERFEAPIAGGTLHTVVLKSPRHVVGMAVALMPTAPTIPATKFTTLNQTTGTLPAGAITGAQGVTLLSSNATPGNQLCRSAAQMLADIGSGVGAGFSYNLRIVNTGAGTFTLAADGGATVTLVGASMTVPQSTYKDFNVTFPTATMCTIQQVGNGIYT